MVHGFHGKNRTEGGMDNARIRRLLATDRFEFSRHGLRRVIERNIADSEIRECAKVAEIIEEYPDDKYLPSCLVFGRTEAGRVLHMQVCEKTNDILKIITIY